MSFRNFIAEGSDKTLWDKRKLDYYKLVHDIQVVYDEKDGFIGTFEEFGGFHLLYFKGKSVKPTEDTWYESKEALDGAVKKIINGLENKAERDEYFKKRDQLKKEKNFRCC